MNARTLAHEWAHQIKPRGKASALSYEGPVIRSYQTAIGRILAPGVYLVNVANFSVTTSGKHQGPMRRAIPAAAITLYYEDHRRGTDLNPSGEQVVAFNYERIGYHCDKATKARSNKAVHHTQAQIAVTATRQAATFYGVPLPDGFEELAVLVARNEANSGAEQAAINARLEAQRERNAAEKLERWLNGEPVTVPHLTHARFRPWKDSDGTPTHVVESTHGALVPLADFTRALRFALARRGKEWHANGETCPVGNYSLSAINAQGVVAGCHRVTWAEIDRLAAILL